MKRNITAKLNNLLDSGASAPLLVLGPRGVGKTYTVCEWAESRRERSIYVNLETDASARLFFEKNGFGSVKDAVYAFLRLDEGTDPGDILLIFDEIQACVSLCELFKAAFRPFGIKICCISSLIPSQLSQSAILPEPLKTSAFSVGYQSQSTSPDLPPPPEGRR